MRRYHSENWNRLSVAGLLETEEKRIENFTITVDELLHFDFSKNLVSHDCLGLLLQLTGSLRTGIEGMFRGDQINNTEGRAVLHVALRNIFASSKLPKPIGVDLEEIQRELQLAFDVAEKIRDGSWVGGSGAPIKSVINLGIGGSDLGPAMVCDALGCYSDQDIAVHFVSNVDPVHLQMALRKCSPESTLIVVVSKTFTTAETLANYKVALDWLLEHFPTSDKCSIIEKHVIGVTANVAKANEHGLQLGKNILRFWDWVGGRFSVWSTVSFSVIISIGKENFLQFLKGASRIDEHFYSEPFHRNAPIIMALISIWYTSICNAETHAVVPYEQLLCLFPNYLQQLEMESNGKGVKKFGAKVSQQTSPILWGTPGTNAQHAYFQLFHQGTHLIPVDVIFGACTSWPLDNAASVQKQHETLIANAIAQTEALAVGNSNISEVPQELIPHMTVPGNRPSTTIVYNRLSPYTLGMLLATYEHKTFVQGHLWDINSFDQFGVELGKKMAIALQKDDPLKHDLSTKSLLAQCKRFQQARTK